MAKRDEPRSGEGRLALGEGGLTRWSRLKREAVAEQKKPAPPPPIPPEAKTAALTPAVPATPPEAGQTEEQKKIEDVTKDLPPIESLGKDSDYTLFMRQGVPEETRVAALRKLWRSDPAFTEKFAFEMHMEDYNETFTPINAATDTIYRAGLGYLFDDDDKTKTEKPPGTEIVDKSAPGGTETGSEMTGESAESLPAAKEEMDKTNLAQAGVRAETPEGEKSPSRKS
ncbi:MAG: DUF3306 domain-containing protein [Pseudomonadota bacterium]